MSHTPPSLTYSIYLENSGMAVGFFFLLVSKREKKGWTLLAFFTCFAGAGAGVACIFFEALAAAGTLFVLLSLGTNAADDASSSPSCSYPRRRVLRALNIERVLMRERERERVVKISVGCEPIWWGVCYMVANDELFYVLNIVALFWPFPWLGKLIN